jgi:hypothetical protein
LIAVHSEMRCSGLESGATCYAPVPDPVVPVVVDTVRAVKGFSEIAWADLGEETHVSWWGWRGADLFI